MVPRYLYTKHLDQTRLRDRTLSAVDAALNPAAGDRAPALRTRALTSCRSARGYGPVALHGPPRDYDKLACRITLIMSTRPLVVMLRLYNAPLQFVKLTECPLRVAVLRQAAVLSQDGVTTHPERQDAASNYGISPTSLLWGS